MLKAITRFSVNYPVSVSMIIIATLLLGLYILRQAGYRSVSQSSQSQALYRTGGRRTSAGGNGGKVCGWGRITGHHGRAGWSMYLPPPRWVRHLIEVEYTWEKDMNEAFLDLSKALSSFNQDDDLEEINITQYDPNSSPVMLVAFQHTETSDLNELRLTAENYVKNELIRLEGIADVEVDGAEELEVLVETNDYLLNSFNLDISTLVSRIESLQPGMFPGDPLWRWGSATLFAVSVNWSRWRTWNRL